MKKIILIFITLFCVPNIVDAASVANNILLTWSVNENLTWAWYWWKLVFPNDTLSWVLVTTSTYDVNTWSWNMWIKWNFWLQNLSSNSDVFSWWTTFDIWNVYFTWTWWMLVPKVILKNLWWNNFRFEWYAWSNSSWWIYFWDTWIVNWSVIYNRLTWKVNWCWWSKNIWWVCIDDFNLDTLPPDLLSTSWQNFSKSFSANNNKLLTTPELISQIDIENWNNLATQTHISTWSLVHDFRKSKNYSFIVTDPTWNTSDPWLINVVSDTPSIILNPNNIWVTNASEFTSTNWNKIWDWNDIHNINFTIRDKYWNLVLNEAWVKNVYVEIWFNNNVDSDQILNLDLWNSIRYSNNPFFLTSWLAWNTWSWYKSDANYNLDIKSFWPTKSWYSITSNNNDISLSNLKVIVNWLSWNTWIWETIPTWVDFISQYMWNFNYVPAAKVIDLSNDRNFNLLRDIESTFTWSVQISKSTGSSSITDLKIKHNLDVISSWVIRNYNMSFQNIVKTNWIQECIWYLRPNSDNTDFIIYSTNSLCDPNSSSNILKNNEWPYTSSDIIYDWFKATPKVVLSWLSSFDLKYSSDMDYYVWTVNIKHKSLEKNYSNSLINNQIKVSWIAHGSTKNFWVTTEGDIYYVWKISKNQVLTNVKKNAYKYKLLWDWNSVNWVLYKSSDYDLNSWPTWIHTIIVDWADLVISNDIIKIPWQIKSIVVLKSDDNTKWDIYIWDNVRFIWATMVTFKSIISWNKINYYSDSWSASNQLFIKWSLITYNTIWWSSASIPKCPYYITSCDFTTAKRHDLNNFRSFSSNSWSPVDWLTYWVDMTRPSYSTSSMIVEYDSELQLNPPEIFLNK